MHVWQFANMGLAGAGGLCSQGAEGGHPSLGTFKDRPSRFHGKSVWELLGRFSRGMDPDPQILESTRRVLQCSMYVCVVRKYKQIQCRRINMN